MKQLLIASLKFIFCKIKKCLLFILSSVLLLSGLGAVAAVLMLIFTLWSGIHYIASYWKYLDPEK